MASTVISTGIVVEGEVVADDDVLIEGVLRGKLTSKDGVTVANGASVEADVEGSFLAISGAMTGNLTAGDRVDLQPGAKVIGNVKAARITIADGAQFKGNVDMDV